MILSIAWLNIGVQLALQQGLAVTSLFSSLALLTRGGKTHLFVLLQEDHGETKLGKK